MSDKTISSTVTLRQIRDREMSRRRPYLAAVVCLAMTAPQCIAQQTSGDANPPSLGEVVRHQKETSQKKAKRVVSDEDMPGSQTGKVRGDFGVQVIIPNVQIFGKAPAPVKIPYSPDQKAFVWFGPDLNRCFDVECAKTTYLHNFYLGLGGPPKILFEADDSVQGYPAKIAHVELKNDVLGKMTGVVAFIATPFSSVAPTCMYVEKNAAEMQPACEEFIGTLEIHVPQKYIYVQRPSY